jgi:hypothetical protein
MSDHMDKMRERSRERLAELKAQGVVVRPKNPLEKLAEMPLSLRRAVTAKCFQCEGEDADPGIKWRIGNCEISDCALHAVRPFQSTLGAPMPTALKTGS